VSSVIRLWGWLATLTWCIERLLPKYVLDKSSSALISRKARAPTQNTTADTHIKEHPRRHPPGADRKYLLSFTACWSLELVLFHAFTPSALVRNYYLHSWAGGCKFAPVFHTFPRCAQYLPVTSPLYLSIHSTLPLAMVASRQPGAGVGRLQCAVLAQNLVLRGVAEESQSHCAIQCLQSDIGFAPLAQTSSCQRHFVMRRVCRERRRLPLFTCPPASQYALRQSKQHFFRGPRIQFALLLLPPLHLGHISHIAPSVC